MSFFSTVTFLRYKEILYEKRMDEQFSYVKSTILVNCKDNTKASKLWSLYKDLANRFSETKHYDDFTFLTRENSCVKRFVESKGLMSKKCTAMDVLWLFQVLHPDPDSDIAKTSILYQDMVQKAQKAVEESYRIRRSTVLERKKPERMQVQGEETCENSENHKKETRKKKTDTALEPEDRVIDTNVFFRISKNHWFPELAGCEWKPEMQLWCCSSENEHVSDMVLLERSVHRKDAPFAPRAYRFMLKVPFQEKEHAKKLGCKYNGSCFFIRYLKERSIDKNVLESVKLWGTNNISDLHVLQEIYPGVLRYFTVPYSEKEHAASLGMFYDRLKKKSFTFFDNPDMSECIKRWSISV